MKPVITSMSAPNSMPPPPEPPAGGGPPDSAPWDETVLGPELPEAAGTAPAVRSDAPTEPMPLTGQGPEKMPTIGHIGRYALKYKIGEGGLGTVYAAHDPLLSRLIAIKTLNVEMAAEERDAFNAMFLNEARAAAGLSHPHIVTVFDAGLADQGAYIAMELLKGRDLRQLRLEGWRPSPTQAATIVRRVADALAYAHSKGVVHRDIKPANIFMVGRTQPRVLDFGIARVAHQHDGGHDGDTVAGSPYYMAPEQVKHLPVDRRADVFSLGVVLYELLTERRPFDGANLGEITRAVTEQEPPAPHEVNPAVPRTLSDIAMRAIEKSPDDRYRSARAFARELRHWLEEHAHDGAGDDGNGFAPAASRKKRVIAGIAAGVLAVAGAAWWALSPRAPAPQVATPAPVVGSVAVTTPVEAPAPVTPPPAPTAATGETSTDTAPEAADSPAAPASEAAATTAPAEPPVAAPPAEPPVTVAEAPKAATTPKATAPEKPRETARERRAREARERAAKAATETAPASGTLRLAVSPWGQVEIDGRPVGTTPPLTEVTLHEGRHTVTIRNADFPPFTTTVNVTGGQPVSIRHRFGS